MCVIGRICSEFGLMFTKCFWFTSIKSSMFVGYNFQVIFHHYQDKVSNYRTMEGGLALFMFPTLDI